MDQNLASRAALKQGLTSGQGASSTQSVTKRYIPFYCFFIICSFLFLSLKSELAQLMMASPPGVSAFIEGDDLFRWQGTVTGPPGSVYDGLTYRISLTFAPTYPYTAPKVEFVTRCFHPNVDEEHGAICLDILKDKWSAVYSVTSILLSLQGLLGEPNIASPLNGYAAQLWNNQPEYAAVLKERYRLAIEKNPLTNN